MGYYELYFNSIVHDDMDNGEYELYHHGVKGQKWGVRRDKYLARMARNQGKIDTLNKKLSTTGAMKRKARAAKAQAKVDKLERRASKARKRLAQGKHLSSRQEKAIMKSEKFKAKVARNSAKNDKWENKKAKLEYKNAKLQKKVDRLNKKIAKEQLNSPETQKKVATGKKAVAENPKLKAAMNKEMKALKHFDEVSGDIRTVKDLANAPKKRQDEIVKAYQKYADASETYRKQWDNEHK